MSVTIRPYTGLAENPVFQKLIHYSGTGLLGRKLKE